MDTMSVSPVETTAHRLTKTGQQKTGKWLNTMKAWVHRACVTSSGCWCDGVGLFPWFSLLSPEWLQNKSPRYKLGSSNWFLDRDVHSNIHSHLIKQSFFMLLYHVYIILAPLSQTACWSINSRTSKLMHLQRLQGCKTSEGEDAGEEPPSSKWPK